ncbi:MAG TPA: hypothetical protein VMV49_12825 [Candidatus Deferrimicrobium sp.]|nr:hypothetical protein [Candidatus Deferrimicrobium sp.]
MNQLNQFEKVSYEKIKQKRLLDRNTGPVNSLFDFTHWPEYHAIEAKFILSRNTTNIATTISFYNSIIPKQFQHFNYSSEKSVIPEKLYDKSFASLIFFTSQKMICVLFIHDVFATEQNAQKIFDKLFIKKLTGGSLSSPQKRLQDNTQNKAQDDKLYELLKFKEEDKKKLAYYIEENNLGYVFTFQNTEGGVKSHHTAKKGNIKKTEKWEKLREEFEKNQWDSLGLGIGKEEDPNYNTLFYESKPKSCVTFDFLDKNKEDEIINSLNIFISHLQNSKEFQISHRKKQKGDLRRWVGFIG